MPVSPPSPGSQTLLDQLDTELAAIDTALGLDAPGRTRTPGDRVAHIQDLSQRVQQLIETHKAVLARLDQVEQHIAQAPKNPPPPRWNAPYRAAGENGLEITALTLGDSIFLHQWYHKKQPPHETLQFQAAYAKTGCRWVFPGCSEETVDAAFQALLAYRAKGTEWERAHQLWIQQHAGKHVCVNLTVADPPIVATSIDQIQQIALDHWLTHPTHQLHLFFIPVPNASPSV